MKCHKLTGHLMQMQLMISSMALDQFRYYHVTLTAMYHLFLRTVLFHISYCSIMIIMKCCGTFHQNQSISLFI